MEKRHKIAILSTFPVWLIKQDIPNPNRHYAVWLLPLYERFANCDDLEIHWITTVKSIKSPQRFKHNNQYFHVLPGRSLTLGLYTAYIQDRLAIGREIKHINPDIIHSWGTEYFYGLCGKDQSKGRIWLHSVQGLLKAYMKRGAVSKFHRRHSFYEPGVLKAAKNITTESEWCAECVRETAPNASPIIWDYAVESRFFLQKRSLSEQPSCLYCGSDAQIKNLETIIEAFSSPELAHIKLILAGPSQRENLPPNIVALGRVSRDEVVKLLSETWCLVHPSKADTGPTAVKEARVMGVPVIATHACGAKRYIVEGKSGFIVHPTDVNSYIKAVKEITETQESSIRFGCYGQEECRQALSAESMFNGLINIYHQLIDNR